MAYKHKGYTKGSNMSRALGKMVGLLLTLYVFDRVINAIWATVNTSVWFATAVSFINTMLPVMGILGAFEIVMEALKGAGLM